MDAGDMSGGYVDAMPLVEAALAELAKGQLIRDERYTMMELMSAIEVSGNKAIANRRLGANAARLRSAGQ